MHADSSALILFHAARIYIYSIAAATNYITKLLLGQCGGGGMGGEATRVYAAYTPPPPPPPRG